MQLTACSRRYEKEPVPDNCHLVRGDCLAVNNEIISGVETTDPAPLCDDLFGDDAGDSQLDRLHPIEYRLFIALAFVVLNNTKRS